MSPRKTILLASALILLVILSGWFSRRAAQRNTGAGPPVTGETAPDFSLQDLGGRSVKLSGYRSQKTVVIAFWASWCLPCRLELPSLQSFYLKNRGPGVEVLAVSIDHDPSAARQFAEQNHLPFPVLLDLQESVASEYQVNEIPSVFVVDRSGALESSRRGLSSGLEAELTAEVRGQGAAPAVQSGP